MELSDEQIRKEIAAVMNKEYHRYVRNSKIVAGSNYDMYGQDLLSFCISEFLTKKPLPYQYQVVVTDKKFENYLAKSMSLNIRSSTSPYWSKMRKESYISRVTYLADNELFQKGDYDEISDFDTPAQYYNPTECMMEALDKLDFYYKELITQYFLNKLTFAQMNKKYGITLNSLHKDMKKAIKKIQQHCKHFITDDTI